MILAHVLVAWLALLQQQPAPGLQPSPVTRIEITPRTREIVAGDSLNYTARAFDASGRPVENARIFFSARGGQGEGQVDSTGKVIASSVGKIPLSVIALVAGARPFVDSTLEIHMVPGAAARIDLAIHPSKLVAGQSILITAVPFSAHNDRSRDAVRWTSSAPAVVRVDDAGLLTAVAPGNASLTAQTGGGPGQDHAESAGPARVAWHRPYRARPVRRPAGRRRLVPDRRKRPRRQRHQRPLPPGAFLPATVSSIPTAVSWPIAPATTS